MSKIKELIDIAIKNHLAYDHLKAIQCYLEILTIDKDNNIALSNLAVAYLEIREFNLSDDVFKVIFSQPNVSSLDLSNYGYLNMLKGDFEVAISYLRKAVKNNNHNQDALFNLASCLRSLKHFNDSIKYFLELFDLNPDYPYLIGNLLHTKAICCDWEDFDNIFEMGLKKLRNGYKVFEPFGFLGLSDSNYDIYVCNSIYFGEKYPNRLGSNRTKKIDNVSKKVNIGFISGEFRNQATSILLVGLLENIDKSLFKTFGFDNGYDDNSHLRHRIASSFDHFIYIKDKGDHEVAELIKYYDVDILFNLNGAFGDSRNGVFSYKPSPIQINFLGYPSTMGLDYYDYIIADSHLIKKDELQYYSESVLLLPYTYQPTDNKRTISCLPKYRSDYDLSDDVFVFACFNNSWKITRQQFCIWMKILRQVDNSVLWLYNTNEYVEINLKREAYLFGVSPNRIIFASFEDPSVHLKRLQLADLMLDTLPYNAHTTANDALWAGLPILTLTGCTFAGRVATSLLKAIGLEELICQTEDEYVNKAIFYGRHPHETNNLKNKLEILKTESKLYDTQQYAKCFEVMIHNLVSVNNKLGV